ncbi:MAG: lipoprotein [Desulfobacterales bacterium]
MNFQYSGRDHFMNLTNFLNPRKPMNFMESGFKGIRTVSSAGVAALVVAMILLLSGCGKKGPPVPPRHEIPPPVTDLSWEINQQILTLSWTVPKVESPIRLAGFKIYRSRKRLSVSDCPDCPGIFEPVADRVIKNPISRDQGGERKMYTEDLETDSRYEYKVVAYTENGISSPDSNIVGFDYQVRVEKDQSEVRQ